jgi:hypothetical protein
MPADREQILRFIEKRTSSLERIERFRSVQLMFEMQGDEEFARDMRFIVDRETALRQLQGRPMAPKIGGMDRRGV